MTTFRSTIKSGFVSGLTIIVSLVIPAYAKHAAKQPAAAPGKQKQIFELSKTEQHSSCLSASGVAAYVSSAGGSNRGLLLRSVENGFASSVGMQPGDVLFSVNNRVIQTGADADRVLESTSPGPARLVFVHPGENGLQLYNAQVNIPTFTAHSSSGSYASAGTTSGAHGSSSGSSIGSSHSNESMPALEKYYVELINHDRTSNGSPAIPENSTLSSLARAHARDMATRNFFNHVNPDGKDPMARAKAAGIRFGVYENIAYQGTFETAQAQLKDAENQMMSEPKNVHNHRSNIIDPSHACCGVGVWRAADGKLFMVQEFCHETP